jgi:hypothetical protein
MVPVVYQRVVDLTHTLDATMQSRSIVGGPDHPDIWEPFIANALNQPVEHRCDKLSPPPLLTLSGGDIKHSLLCFQMLEDKNFFNFIHKSFALSFCRCV